MVPESASSRTPSDPVAPVSVLVVDDNRQLRKSIGKLLVSRGLAVDEAEDGNDALRHLSGKGYDVVLTDLKMPNMCGDELLEQIRRESHDCQVVVMTAFSDVAAAVAAVRAGAFGFLTKPFASNDVLVTEVLAAAKLKLLRERSDTLQREVGGTHLGTMVGTSIAMRNMYRLVSGFGPTHASVLVLGETGTGKELVARALHASSPRVSKPLVTVNCASIPSELIESELFGHVRGSFTSALATRAGLFEAAHGGTLFLDEVGELELPAQAKLLRALESGELRRVGSDVTHSVDVRVVAATNGDLGALVRKGLFRQDLFYRLNVATIRLPPLRERGDDALLLAHHFLAKFSERSRRTAPRIEDEAVRFICEYAWPGNVRELEHAMEHAFILARGNAISADALPASVRDSVNGGARRPANPLDAEVMDMPFAEARRLMLERFSDAYLARVLDLAGGSINDAARRAGLDPSNFRKLLRRRDRE